MALQIAPAKKPDPRNPVSTKNQKTWKIILGILLSAFLPVSLSAASVTANFNEMKVDSKIPYNYPASGFGAWNGFWVARAYDAPAFDTNSISTNSSSRSSASVVLAKGYTLQSFSVANGGNSRARITVSCPYSNNAAISFSLEVGASKIINTNWSKACAKVVFKASNTWSTDYDNLVFAQVSSISPSPTPTPAPTIQPSPVESVRPSPTLAPTPTPASTSIQSSVAIFDGMNANFEISSNYPANGFGAWNGFWVTNPYDAPGFSTHSISTNSASLNTGSIELASGYTLTSFDASNSSSSQANVIVVCSSNANSPVSFTLASGQYKSISTHWSVACPQVTFTTTTAWSTDYDNLVFSQVSDSSVTGNSPDTSTPTPKPTATPTPRSTATPTPAATATPTPAPTPSSSNTDTGRLSPTEILPSNFTYAQLENAAKPGAVVGIPGGRYRFRVQLNNTSTDTRPIVLQALDPNNRPIFDYTNLDLNSDIGSYKGGDKYRGCWLITGRNYVIDGVVIQGCAGQDGNSAGIRLMGPRDITIRHSLIQNSQQGIFGGGQNVTVEYCEFYHNGYDDYNHNIYITGGDNFTLRYSYIHDSGDPAGFARDPSWRDGGQNIHMRAWHSTIEYNWIARASSYEFDIMPNTGQYDPSGFSVPANRTHYMIFRGNMVYVRKDGDNYTKVMTMYNDTSTNPAIDLQMSWNTFYLPRPLSNDRNMDTAIFKIDNDGFSNVKVDFSNNLVGGNGRKFTLITGSRNNVQISGTKNYFMNGASVPGLVNTIFGADPLFKNPAALDFTLNVGSPAIGAADPNVSHQPEREYYKNESIKLMYRNRQNYSDLGAFESTSTGGGTSN